MTIIRRITSKMTFTRIAISRMTVRIIIVRKGQSVKGTSAIFLQNYRAE